MGLKGLEQTHTRGCLGKGRELSKPSSFQKAPDDYAIAAAAAFSLLSNMAK